MSNDNPLVRVPEHVDDRLDEEKAKRNVPKGAIIEGWMRDSDTLADIQGDFKDAMQTRGGGDE